MFGLDNSTLETQALAIDLARKLGAVLDECLVVLLRSSSSSESSKKELPTCSLSDVKDKADLLLYWGANPHRHPPAPPLQVHVLRLRGFHPRWMVSQGHAEFHRRSRPTELTAMSNTAFKIKPRGDRELISGLLGESPAARVLKPSSFVRTDQEVPLLCHVLRLGLVHLAGQ